MNLYVATVGLKALAFLVTAKESPLLKTEVWTEVSEQSKQSLPRVVFFDVNVGEDGAKKSCSVVGWT